MPEIEIKTGRLLLRQWRDADQSKAMMERSRQSWSERGYGRFAVEVPGVAVIESVLGQRICD